MTLRPSGLTSTVAAAMLLVASQGWAQRSGTATAGSFQNLSPGNQSIAHSLFLAQHPTPNGPAPLSLNQIAALKATEGWGQVFNQMKSEGLVDAKNLGQVVSGYEHQLRAGAANAASVHAVPGPGPAPAAGGGHGDGELHADAAGAGAGRAGPAAGIISAGQSGASAAAPGGSAFHGSTGHAR
jgi:hypothetical protein